jgi:Domain of unknown function (DUF4845)
MQGSGSFSARQRGVSLIGLLFWGVLAAFVGYVLIQTLPTMNEYATIKRAVTKISREGPSTVPEIRNAFEKQKEIEYSIASVSGKDLEITKEGDKVVIRFAYDKVVPLIAPVYLLIRYEGSSN